MSDGVCSPCFRNTSPLHWAVYNGRIQILQLLVLADAIFTLKILYEFPKNLSVMRNKGLFDWLRHHASTVKSLQCHARTTIRQVLVRKTQGRSIMAHVYKLPLPAQLQRFLGLEHENLQKFDEDEPYPGESSSKAQVAD